MLRAAWLSALQLLSAGISWPPVSPGPSRAAEPKGENNKPVPESAKEAVRQILCHGGVATNLSRQICILLRGSAEAMDFIAGYRDREARMLLRGAAQRKPNKTAEKNTALFLGDLIFLSLLCDFDFFKSSGSDLQLV